MDEITLDRAARALESTEFNFLRRSPEKTLGMFGGHWRLAEQTPDTLIFRPVAPSGAYLPDEQVLSLSHLERITWERLPRQKSRSQIRFHLPSGEQWIFSGHVDDALLP